jgi:hypothetical protein
MSWLAGARARLRLVLTRQVVEDRMEEEFRFHVEMETEKLIRAGVSPREARRRALVAFGGLERHRESMRDGRGVRWLADLVQDLRFALRSLARRPGFTVVAVATIAVRVGATTVVFTLVNAMLLTADDERAVVVAHHVWRDRFGGDPEVAGRVVHLDGRPYTVAGVAPRGFTGMTPAVAADVWVPIAAARAEGLEGMSSWVAMFGRLRPGQDGASADALLNVVARSVPPDEPQTTVRGAALDPMTGMLRGQARTMGRTALALLLGAAFLVLLIASINTAGMLLARGIGRRRELAVRVTLGAARGRLVRQLVAESGLLAILGGTGGVLLALLGTRLAATTPMPLFATLIGLDLRLDLRVLVFALVLTATTAVLFGFLPALHASRPALARALKEGGSGAATARAPGRSVFVSAQLAMAVLLLVIAGLFVQSFSGRWRPISDTITRAWSSPPPAWTPTAMTRSGAARSSRRWWSGSDRFRGRNRSHWHALHCWAPRPTTMIWWPRAMTGRIGGSGVWRRTGSRRTSSRCSGSPSWPVAASPRRTGLAPRRSPW